MAAAVTTAVDFTDDPFKDYRYEDPFCIKDPFSDEVEGTIELVSFMITIYFIESKKKKQFPFP